MDSQLLSINVGPTVFPFCYCVERLCFYETKKSLRNCQQFVFFPDETAGVGVLIILLSKVNVFSAMNKFT